jgi:phage tail sheath gpL-like
MSEQVRVTRSGQGAGVVRVCVGGVGEFTFAPGETQAVPRAVAAAIAADPEFSVEAANEPAVERAGRRSRTPETASETD